MPKANNPAEAHRKALKAKDKKRNKEARQKAKDAHATKGGVSELTAEISTLTDKETTGTITKEEKAQLAKLQSEFDRIRKAKAEQAAANAAAQEPKASTSALVDDESQYFRKDGKLKNPKRSIYYDPVFNPYGVPPPGMPYKERSRSPEDPLGGIEIEEGVTNSEKESSRDEDEDSSEFEDSDGVVMPDGPAPSKEGDAPLRAQDYYLPRPVIQGTQPPPPKGPVPTAPPKYMPLQSESTRPVVSRPNGDAALPVPPPPGPPPGFKTSSSLPPGFSSQPISPTPTSLPAKPSIPYVPHALPSKPVGPATPAVISGEAQIRDLKAEATTFVPTTLKRKREIPLSSSEQPQEAPKNEINAAPDFDAMMDQVETEQDDQASKRPSLLSEIGKAGFSES